MLLTLVILVTWIVLWAYLLGVMLVLLGQGNKVLFLKFFGFIQVLKCTKLVVPFGRAFPVDFIWTFFGPYSYENE